MKGGQGRGGGVKVGGHGRRIGERERDKGMEKTYGETLKLQRKG